MQQFLGIFALAAVAALVVATLLANAIGGSGFPLPPDDRRLGCIDGLRGYLALAVLIHHFFIWTQVTRLNGTWSPPSIHFVNQLGAGSVGLFFMTTGLVFYPRVLTGLRATPWTVVYITRVFRIMPLVIAATALVSAIIIARTGATPHIHDIEAVARWISTWNEAPLMAYPDSGRLNAYVLWSLWYEWLFYLFVLPACAAAMDVVRARQLPTWTVPLTLLGIGLLAQLVAKLLDCKVGIFFYLPLFAAGMLAFEFQSRPTVRAALAQPRIAVVAAIALLIAMATTPDPYSLSLPIFGFFFTCVACMAMPWAAFCADVARWYWANARSESICCTALCSMCCSLMQAPFACI